MSGPLKLEKTIYEIRSAIEDIENQALAEETNFGARIKAIDYIEFHIIDRIEGLLVANSQAEKLASLKQLAESMRDRLEKINAGLFQRLGAGIISGNYTGADLKHQLDEYVAVPGEKSRDDAGYDSLDMFVNGLLRIDGAPQETKAREAEMVFYQPTPVRIILELVEKANVTKEDVFYDLGSGLGQVPILVNLLSGVVARGIEFEPAYCDYARQCAQRLGLSRVKFINTDAREADYSDGTIFFMYTPFQGEMLQEVLTRLRNESRNKAIRLYTYGPCTPQVSQQSWLERLDHNGDQVYKLAVFKSG